eukprot:scaffold241_cov89-Cylindrotheca_fusiformis.AAC.5
MSCNKKKKKTCAAMTRNGVEEKTDGIWDEYIEIQGMVGPLLFSILQQLERPIYKKCGCKRARRHLPARRKQRQMRLQEKNRKKDACKKNNKKTCAAIICAMASR